MPTRYLLNPVRVAGEFLRRRRAARQPTFIDAATVSAPELAASLTCAVRDMSTSGARLEIERERGKAASATTLPDLVDIYFGRKQTEVRARVMWRDGSHFGVAFLSRPESAHRKAS
ncbi:MAG: PilZ domain-containing protein [Hyphomicrobium sp.]